MSNVQLNTHSMFTAEELSFLDGKANAVMMAAIERGCPGSFKPDSQKERGVLRVWEKRVLHEAESSVLNRFSLTSEAAQLIMRFLGASEKNEFYDEAESNAFAGVNLSKSYSPSGQELFDERDTVKAIHRLDFNYVKTKPNPKFDVLGARLTPISNCASIKLSTQQMVKLMRLDGQAVSCTLERVDGVMMPSPINSHLSNFEDYYHGIEQRKEMAHDFLTEIDKLKLMLEQGARSASKRSEISGQMMMAQRAWDALEDDMAIESDRDVDSILNHACKATVEAVASLARRDTLYSQDKRVEAARKFLKESEGITLTERDYR